MTKTVVALYDDYGAAQEAVADLVKRGFRRDDISLVASDGEPGGKADIHPGSPAADAAGAASVGAVFGGLAGLLVGLGALAIPGIGPIVAAGPLAATLAGAGVGAVAGGLGGALADAGVPRQEAATYAEGVRRGGTLVTVRVADELAARARDIFDSHDAVDVQSRVADWRQGGWGGPESDLNESYEANPDDEPVTADDAGADNEQAAQAHDTRRQEGYGTAPTRIDERIGPAGADAGFGDVAPAGRAPDRHAPGGYGDEPVDYRSREPRGDVYDDSAIEVQRSAPENMGAQEFEFDRFEPEIRANHELLYAGQDYESYRPAYRFGYDLANDAAGRGRRWSEVELDARRQWEQGHPGQPWDDFRNAVRWAWERGGGGASAEQLRGPDWTTGPESRAGRPSYQGPEDQRI